jgi:hypothetical protein
MPAAKGAIAKQRTAAQKYGKTIKWLEMQSSS